MHGPDSWERRFATGLLRHRAAVIVVLGLVTALAAVSATRLRFESSIDIWFVDGDPDVLAYDAFLDRFEADELTVLALFCDDVFSPEALAAVDRITRAAEEAPHAHRVRSLTNLQVAKATDDGISIGPLVEELPRTDAAAQAIRRTAFASPLLAGIVAADAKATAILIELSRDGATFEGKVEQVSALEAIIAREQVDGRRLMLSGTAPFDAVFYRLSKRDFLIFGPLMLLVIIVATFLVFRRLSAVVVPISVVLMASTWLFGLMAAFDIPINVLSSGLTAVVLAVGVADSIHVLADYYQELMAGRSKQAAVEQTLVNLLVPCSITSATTVAGMLSLYVSDLQPVREFGVLAAVGVSIAFFISITFVPVVLSLARPPEAAFIERQKRGPIAVALTWLGSPTRRRAVRTVFYSALLLGVMLTGLARLRVGANTMNYFREDEPVRVETYAIDEALGGTASIDLLVSAPNEGLKEPANLQRLDKFSRWLEARPGVGQSLSVVDSLKDLHRVLEEDAPGTFRLPESRPLTAQLYLLLEGEQDFDTEVQDNYETGRITARIRMSEAEALLADMSNVENRLTREFAGEDLEVKLTGFVKLMSNMETYLLDSQIRSILVAFLVVTAMLMLVLRSLRLGLFSMIPNLIPVVFGVGFMGHAGVPLDPGTVMIGAIALGLVVDDTVHFMVRLRRHLGDDADVHAAIRNSIGEAGRPIIVTSLVLAGAFFMLLLASFTPNMHFGLVAGVVILTALLADLVLLPAALLVLRPKL